MSLYKGLSCVRGDSHILSLIVHKDHTKLDYIPLSARKQQSWFRETQMLLTGLLREEARILLREEARILLREEARILLREEARILMRSK